MRKNEDASNDNRMIEFGSIYDPFLNSRNKGTLRWILKHLSYKKNKIYILIWLISATVSTYLSTIISLFIGDAIQSFIDGEFSNLIKATLLILIVGVGSPLIGLISRYYREKLAQMLERDTRDEFYSNLLGKSQSVHDQLKIGDIMGRATSDVTMLNYLISPAISLIFDSVIMILMPIILIIRNLPLQLVYLPIIFIVFFIFSVIQYYNKLLPVTDNLRENYGMMNAVSNETISGIEVVKGLTLESYEQKKYLQYAEKYKNFVIKRGKIQATYLPLLVIGLVITGGLLHGSILISKNLISIGDTISYLGLLNNLMRPISISIWAISIVARAKSASQRLLETMKKSGEIDQNLDGIDREINGNIEFRNVSFKYPESNKFVLKKIDFSIKAGETIAIVGTTGSGKTTLTKLLSRLYNNTKGEILIDGIPINNYKLAALRNQISYIEQDVFLFSKSIFDNISFGRVSSEEEVIKAAIDAQAHDFIMKYPNKYKTLIGEKGVQLSGGEKQRIAIARAFISNPRILILDDSTSAIDSETEDKIQKAIRNILKSRTTILITHRLSQIRWADKILVLKKGEIVALGDHYSLLKTCDEYSKIFIKRFDKSYEELIGGAS